MYYEKYPEDIKRIHDLAKYFEHNRVDLPAGGYMNAMRLRQLGLNLGVHGTLFQSFHVNISANLTKRRRI